MNTTAAEINRANRELADRLRPQVAEAGERLEAAAAERREAERRYHDAMDSHKKLSDRLVQAEADAKRVPNFGAKTIS